MQELFCFNKKKSLIVICLSIYNGSQFLNNQLVSLKNQTYNHNNILLLIRDDGSHDESYEVSKQFAAESSMHIELLDDRTNLGVKKSFELLMNKALEMDARYIMFCDQDDVWHPEKISKTIAMMEQMEVLYPQQPILIHSDLTVVDHDLTIIHNSFWQYQNIDPSKNSFNRLLMDNVATGCTMMINRTLAKMIGTIPNEAIMHDWWITMVASIFGHIAFINESLILYRQHNNNDTGAKSFSLFKALKLWDNRGLYVYIDRTKVQAWQFLCVYKKQLNIKTVEMLQNFCTIQNNHFFKKRYIILKYQLYRQGFMRTAELFMRI